MTEKGGWGKNDRREEDGSLEGRGCGRNYYIWWMEKVRKAQEKMVGQSEG